jgi:ABC-type nitrate/sulfonate/bicarbonate transport system ATPase subunit
VLVLSARPAKIQATFEVKLPHPRRLTSQDVQQLRTAILRELGVEQDAPVIERGVAHG